LQSETLPRVLILDNKKSTRTLIENKREIIHVNFSLMNSFQWKIIKSLI